jgi:hypothetical protein
VALITSTTLIEPGTKQLPLAGNVSQHSSLNDTVISEGSDLGHTSATVAATNTVLASPAFHPYASSPQPVFGSSFTK